MGNFEIDMSLEKVLGGVVGLLLGVIRMCEIDLKWVCVLGMDVEFGVISNVLSYNDWCGQYEILYLFIWFKCEVYIYSILCMNYDFVMMM